MYPSSAFLLNGGCQAFQPTATWIPNKPEIFRRKPEQDHLGWSEDVTQIEVRQMRFARHRSVEHAERANGIHIRSPIFIIFVCELKLLDF